MGRKRGQCKGVEKVRENARKRKETDWGGENRRGKDDGQRVEHLEAKREDEKRG